LAVGGPRHQNTEHRARNDIEGVMTGVHDARAGDEGSAESWDHDNEGPPDLALGIQDVQFRSKVERKVEQARKGDCMLSMAVRGPCGLVLTAAMSRGKALESILQDVVVLLVADCDILESILNGSVDPVLHNNAAAVCQQPRKTLRAEDSPAYEVRPRLPDGVLERACDGEGCADAKTQA
jgi:hypothetical protein